MAKFEGKIIVEYINGNSWLLLEDYVYFSDVKGVGQVTVPAGFMTDFNSVPRLFWRVFPKTEYGGAAVIHDYLCVYGEDNGISRKMADQVFEEALKTLGASWWRRKAMYIGVRIGALI